MPTRPEGIHEHDTMTDELTLRRRFYAEELEVVCNIRNRALVDALAAVPRERFLRPGPWLIRGEGDFGGPPRQTPDADPRHVYHNVSIAIDASRELFNGAPGVVVLWIDALAPKPGDRVLHVGCGLGYYSSLVAHCVGPTGRVVAIEIDEALVTEARANLTGLGGIEVVRGDGSDTRGEAFDAILVNVGVTHPLDAWLEALKPGGRLVLPLTCTMGSNVGKGFVLLISASGEGEAMDVRVITMVAVYSAAGIRDRTMNDRLGKAFMRGPWPSIKRLRRDSHEASPSCWLHGDSFCLSAT